MANTTNSKTHIPGAGNSYLIATDGDDCLIIKGVEIGHKFYDIKIWAKDVNGNPVRTITTESQFPKDLIRRAALSATTLFNSIASDKIAHTKVWFSDTGQDAGRKISCHLEDLTAKTTQPFFEGANLNGIAPDQNKIIRPAQEIHSLFFNPSVSFAEEHEMISPHFEYPSHWLDGIQPQYMEEPSAPPMKPEKRLQAKETNTSSSSKANSKPKSGTLAIEPAAQDEKSDAQPVEAKPVISKKTNNASHHKVNNEKPRSQINQSAAHKPALAEEEEEFDNLPTTAPAPEPILKNLWAELKGPNGITYEGLQKYSNTPNKFNSKYANAYQSFENLLNDPNDADEEEMYNWLQELYKKAYLNNRESREFYQKQQSSLEFNEWCRYNAAVAVAGFIKSKISGNKLVESLKNYIILEDIPSN